MTESRERNGADPVGTAGKRRTETDLQCTRHQRGTPKQEKLQHLAIAERQAQQDDGRIYYICL